MRLAAKLVLLAFVGAGIAAACASAESPRATLSFRLVASGLSNPTFVTAPAGQRGTIYVVEKTGKVIVFVNGKRRAQPFST
jgi:hypothetical protein